jgi:hypothetical protein
MESDFTLERAAREVGLAIRTPEDLVTRWRDVDGRPFDLLIAVLLANAVFGTAAYGVTMQLHKGAWAMLYGGFSTALAAGLAWMIALPSLYIINSALGSQLSLRASILAASVTVCFGAWAMLASVPINWFFTLALPNTATRLLVNLAVFTGVGICMTDVFLRALRTLDTERPQTFGRLWIVLLGIIGTELFILFGVFSF